MRRFAQEAADLDAVFDVKSLRPLRCAATCSGWIAPGVLSVFGYKFDDTHPLAILGNEALV
jgi:hypothetical protein